MNVIGPQLQTIRKQRHMTLEALSISCNLMGLNITKTVLSKIENQQRKVSDIEAMEFAKVLEMPIQSLYK